MDPTARPKPVRSPSSGSLHTHLIRGAAGSFVLQVGFAGLALLNAVILGRLLGAGGYGAFANAVAWVNILVIPATFGFGTLLIRDIAIYRYRGQWAALKGLLYFSNRFVFALSTLFALVLLAIAEFVFSAAEENTMRLSLWIAAPLLPLFALSNLRESACIGFEHVFRARLPSLIFRPGLLLIGIILVYLLWPNHLSVPLVLALNVGAATITLIVSIFWVRKILPSEVKQAQPEYQARLNLTAAFPMLVYGGMQVIMGQTDILMVGLLRAPEEVGLYAAASRLASVLVYVMMAINVLMAPIIARLYANGEKARIQTIVTKAVRIAFSLVLPLGLILIVAGENILGLFGHDFVPARTALTILAVGLLVDIAMGVGTGPLVLTMTGHARVVASIFSAAAILNVVLNFLFIPNYGIEGAALASMISLFCAKILLSSYAVMKADLHVTVLGVYSGSERKKV